MPTDDPRVLHATVHQPQMLVRALSDDQARLVLITDGGEEYNAGQLAALTSQYCGAFKSAGFQPGARIGILAGNRPEVIHVGHAALLNRYVIVPFHPRGALADYLYVVDDAEIETIVFDPEAYAQVVAEIAAARPTVRLLALGPSSTAEDLAAAACRQRLAPLRACEVRDDDVFRLSYSGGTTGRPKAIIGTHRYATAMLAIQLAEWQWPSDIRQLICAPISHSGAALFLPTLLRGGWALLHSGFNPGAVLAAIERHKINCILLVPTMIYAMLDHPDFEKYDLSSLETIFYGASPMSPVRLREAIERIGPVFFQFYGQAEAPMTVTVLRREDHDIDDPLRLSSCGKPVPWVTVALLDDDNREVTAGEAGEICVRGPLVMQGYHNQPEQTAAALKGGWLHTGDVGVRDSLGFLRIVDRKKDMIITGGYNVYPREIEDVLATHSSVAGCAVIGIPDDRWGEAVKALVVLRAGCAPCADELIALVKSAKGAVQAPKSIQFIDEIPLTAVGKPDKKLLRQMPGFTAVPS